MKSGCCTALITPFHADGIDMDGLSRLIDFQLENKISGILAAGTTGESPTLSWEEHNRVIETIAGRINGRAYCIAGTGSNNTAETLAATAHAAQSGADAVLMVDPYYNGPSSMEIRKEYFEPVASAFPDLTIIPYIIPGRTGTRLAPEDLAICARKHPNVSAVKDATGDLTNMRRTRECAGDNFTILSGDDNLTCRMMKDPTIQAAGVISVISNIAPRAVEDMVFALSENRVDDGDRLNAALSPLFDIVTVTTTEQTPFGAVSCKARNPLAVKTLMKILGMPSGPCRRPMGKMSKNGLDQVIDAARRVFSNNPEIFAPIAAFFHVDIEARLYSDHTLNALCYEDY